jgi:hypothetical protein
MAQIFAKTDDLLKDTTLTTLTLQSLVVVTSYDVEVFLDQLSQLTNLRKLTIDDLKLPSHFVTDLAKSIKSRLTHLTLTRCFYESCGRPDYFYFLSSLSKKNQNSLVELDLYYSWVDSVDLHNVLIWQRQSLKKLRLSQYFTHQDNVFKAINCCTNLDSLTLEYRQDPSKKFWWFINSGDYLPKSALTLTSLKHFSLQGISYVYDDPFIFLNKKLQFLQIRQFCGVVTKDEPPDYNAIQSTFKKRMIHLLENTVSLQTLRMNISDLCLEEGELRRSLENNFTLLNFKHFDKGGNFLSEILKRNKRVHEQTRAQVLVFLLLAKRTGTLMKDLAFLLAKQLWITRGH